MSFFLQLLKLAICAALTNVADGQTGNVAGDWMLVAIGSKYQPFGTEARGDLDNCPDEYCKLSDDAINELDFSVIKFEPENAVYGVTYFDFTGRTFDSALVVEPCSTPWTLDEQQSLAGVFDGVETCCLYDVCNFGRGHCAGTVKSSYGWQSGGGCGAYGPIPGLIGTEDSATRFYVLTGQSTVCDEAEIATFDWDSLTESGLAKPEVMAFSMSVDSSDLSLNIEVQLTFEGRASADGLETALYGTTYVLDFGDFDAHADSIAQPGTCQNRNAGDFTGDFDTFWEYPLSPSDIGTATYLAYPPPDPVNGAWSVAVDDAAPCGVVVYTGKFTWNDLVACQDYALSKSYITSAEDETTGVLSLRGTFYANVVSPFSYSGDFGYYRVYQLLSQPFVLSVKKNIQVIGAAGINLFTISVIAVFKEEDATVFKLVLLTESAEYMQLSRIAGTGLAAFESSSEAPPVIADFTVSDTAENDGCLDNKDYICSQLWQIESDGDCSSAQAKYIDFSGSYALQFIPECRAASDVGTDLFDYCGDWLSAHSDIADGVGLVATLQWRDEECDPILFEVQFEAEMLFYTDAAYSSVAASDTLFQVGEDRIYVEVETTFPGHYSVFDTVLLNVWICTFDPLSPPSMPIEPAELSGGCFSTTADGADDEDTEYAYHIYDSAGTVTVPDFIALQLDGHPTTNDVDKDTLRFSFVVPPKIARDTLYVHAQLEVSLTGARRRLLRKVVPKQAMANQMSHFMGSFGVRQNPKPNHQPPPSQPQPQPFVPSVGGHGTHLLTLQSPWIVVVAVVVAAALVFNLVLLGYANCCGNRRGRTSDRAVSKESEFEDSEVNAPMNVVSEWS